MKHLDEYRDHALVQPLVAELEKAVVKPVRLMEVCGTHTMSLFRNGVRSILPENMEIVSGPGCPVCVTSASHIDAFLLMAERPGVQVTIFGDLFRVPGTDGSLALASSRGARVTVVYSPADAVELARNNPDDIVVFLGVGFETTTPAIAATILAAEREGIDNYCVFSTHKVIPGPLEILMADPDLKINALLCPGHVSTIIGASAYQPFVDKFGLACVVAGFEAADLLNGLILLARQVASGEPKVENIYPRAVSWEGNKRAMTLVNEVFEPVDMEWRGLGLLPDSGLAIKEKYESFDAQKRLNITIPAVDEPKGCLCGQILKGKTVPPECPLFARRCTPAHPVGPCMVSSEGTCAAYHKYGR
ncbi:MAG: hydrogenase formation protein HypD [Proteobacteria bacterium]|nr:MAG: hydrogenase formation protein HypD [Pseudomonadota bacterium]